MAVDEPVGGEESSKRTRGEPTGADAQPPMASGLGSAAKSEVGVSAQKSHSNAARHLMELWAVTAGLALVKCMENFITAAAPDAPRDVEWASLPLLVAFLVTLIPFYHGTLQHLNLQWNQPDSASLRSWLLLLDFGALFLQACLFFAMAQFLGSPESFAFCLFLLLCLDCVWAICIWFSQTSADRQFRLRRLKDNLKEFYTHFRTPLANAEAGKKPQLNWFLVNLHAGIALIGTMIVFQANERFPLSLFNWIVAGLALVRTVFDYAKSRSFYFPPAVL